VGCSGWVGRDGDERGGVGEGMTGNPLSNPVDGSHTSHS